MPHIRRCHPRPDQSNWLRILIKYERNTTVLRLNATHRGKQRIKIIARYQQYEGANKLVARVVAGHPKKGLIWHFQGSGKSPKARKAKTTVATALLKSP